MSYRSSSDINLFVKRNNLLGVKQCLEENPQCINNVDTEGLTPLHWACLDGYEAIVHHLIDSGAERSPKSIEEGHTPLAYAAIKGHTKIFAYLIRLGVKDIPDHKGYLVLHHAAMYNRVEILFLALQLMPETPIDVKDSFGHTPLMWAAYEGHQAAIEYLLAEGASVNASDEKGWTSLSWAVKTKRIPIAELLLQRGASLSVIDTDGQSLSDIARATTNYQTVDYIELVRGDTTGQIALKGRAEYYKWAYFNWAPLFLLYIISVLSLVPYFIIGLPIALAGPLLAWRYYGERRWSWLNESRNTYLIGQTWWGMTMSSLLWLLHILPNSGDVYSLSNILFFLWGFGFTIIFHTLLFRGPGVLEKNTVTKPVIQLALENGQGNRYCLTCLLKKPSRSKHCKVTGNCVARFDHYCPWIANAVGIGNYNHFIFTIFWVTMGHWAFITICIFYLKDTLSFPDASQIVQVCFTQEPVVFLSLLFQIGIGCGNTHLLFTQTRGIIQNLTTNEVKNYDRYFANRAPVSYGSPWRNAKEFLFPSVDWRTKFDGPVNDV